MVAAGSADTGEAVAICPKMSSTFPGVEVYKLGNNDKTKYETQLCKDQGNRPTSRIAKFKQSVSCAYTGSILSYYHLSRILGDALNVPTAVIRTMDVSQHAKVAKRGSEWSSDLNQKLWQQVLGYDSNVRPRANYFSADGRTVFGALSMNPKGEERYVEINQNFADPTTSRLKFLERAQVQRIFNQAGVGSLAQRTLASAAPVLQQMRDISDLIVVDHIMQQQDRFGNIHYQDYYYYQDASGNIDRKRISRSGDAITTPKPTPDAVIVKRMLLKDNDCGSRAGNPKAFSLDDVKRIRHMSPRTYRGIRFLAQAWRNGTAKTFFQTEALLNTPDALESTGIDDFGRRLLNVADTLYANCKAGNLLLDLSIEDHLKGLNLPEQVKQRCEEIHTPDGNNENKNPQPVPTAPVPQPTVVNQTPTPVTPVFSPRGCTVTSNDGAANVRKSPNGDIYMVLNNGASVRAVGEDGSWYSVEYRLNQLDHGGKFGRPAWIFKTLLNCN